MKDYQQLYEDEVESHKKTKISLRKKEHELHAITSSASYKLAKKVAKSKHAVMTAKNYAHHFSPKRTAMLVKNKRYINKFYESDDFASNFPSSTIYKTAVVIHLYYTDLAKYFAQKLESLDGVIDYDLYVSIPDFKADEAANVLKALPKAHLAIVPNCGRDVLPFIQVMKHLKALGYDKVLKLHSKKSPHRTDGNEWRDEIVGSLLPDIPAHVKAVIDLLEEPSTAMIGPSKQYVSLLVNFTASTHHSRKILPKLIGEVRTSKLMAMPEDYGFFGGTMFWARTDAIEAVLDNVDSHDFEPELGQEDSTLAHAMERLLCVIPEIEGKAMYEISDTGIRKVKYATTNIPSWSEMSIDHL